MVSEAMTVVAEELASALADVADELPPGHPAAWCAVLRRASGPDRTAGAALIEARPGYAMSGTARRLIAAWRRSDASGESVALAL